uniref:Uncharacterized protein n=1 Tax=Pseudictyota dubia TaxID=2749911 RepID=A0A7R9VWP8_9STRA|mmetsp:Transcript_24936/g.46138  ORF Transcript_24936/g.46138 Transcript_24936/m.46138 type:complete len:822 (+) Transcript_24936:96-2561(+)
MPHQNDKNEPASGAVVHSERKDSGSGAVPEVILPNDRLPPGAISAASAAEAVGSDASSSCASTCDKSTEVPCKKPGNSAARQRLSEKIGTKVHAGEGDSVEKCSKEKGVPWKNIGKKTVAPRLRERIWAKEQELEGDSNTSQSSEGHRKGKENASTVMDEKTRIKERRMLGPQTTAGSQAITGSVAGPSESRPSILDEKARLKQRRLMATRVADVASPLALLDDSGIGVATVHSSPSGSEISAQVPELRQPNPDPPHPIVPGAHAVPGTEVTADELMRQSADRNDSAQTEGSVFCVPVAEAVDMNDAGGDVVQDLTRNMELLQQKVDDQQRQLEKQQQQQAAAVVAEPVPVEQSKSPSSPVGQWCHWFSNRKILAAVLGVFSLLVVCLAVGLSVAMKGSSSAALGGGTMNEPSPAATSSPSLRPMQRPTKAAILTPSHSPTKRFAAHSPAPTRSERMPVLLPTAVQTPSPPTSSLTSNSTTQSPTPQPTASLSAATTLRPSARLTSLQPSQLPTAQPSSPPTLRPTFWPTSFPTQGPTVPEITLSPTTLGPTSELTMHPTHESLGALHTAICSRLPGTCSDLSAEGTPQSIALAWVASDPNFDTQSVERQIQRYAMGTIYHSVVGWGENAGGVDWMERPEDECTWNWKWGWEAVLCDGEGRVKEIYMNYKLMAKEGTPLPRDVVLLNNSLEELSFGSIGFGHTIPTEYGWLTKLTSFSLSDCDLTGTIPSSLGSLTNVVDMQLGHNELRGTMPAEVCALRDNKLANLVSDCRTAEVQCSCCTNCPSPSRAPTLRPSSSSTPRPSTSPLTYAPTPCNRPICR